MTDTTNEGRLAGRVVVVTGAGRGIGAEYAKLAAAAGAKVIVNDMGGGIHGEQNDGPQRAPADEVVDEIAAAGGEAEADRSDVSDFEGAKALITHAHEAFGGLDVLINNAGILRDRMLVTMSEQEFDDVIRVHLRGHFNTTHHAANYWREQTRDTGSRDRVLIQTSSIAGLHGNVGQFNYSAAKAGIATMAVNGHLELNERYGVRSYAIAPSARTRLTLSSPGAVDGVKAPEDDSYDFFAPDNVAPFVVWLAAADCAAPSGFVFGVEGDLVRRYEPWSIAVTITNNGKKWSFGELDAARDELFAGARVTSVQDVVQLTNEHVDRLRAVTTS